MNDNINSHERRAGYDMNDLFDNHAYFAFPRHIWVCVNDVRLIGLQGMLVLVRCRDRDGTDRSIDFQFTVPYFLR